MTTQEKWDYILEAEGLLGEIVEGRDIPYLSDYIELALSGDMEIIEEIIDMYESDGGTYE